jgi:phage-related protein
MAWVVEYYIDSKGREPAADFIDSLSIPGQAKILRLIDLLADYGFLLKEPYTRQIKGKLRKLRITDKSGEIRILYFGISRRRFILLHGFNKKTRKAPVKEIEIAERRMSDFIERYGG